MKLVVEEIVDVVDVEVAVNVFDVAVDVAVDVSELVVVVDAELVVSVTVVSVTVVSVTVTIVVADIVVVVSKLTYEMVAVPCIVALVYLHDSGNSRNCRSVSKN